MAAEQGRRGNPRTMSVTDIHTADDIETEEAERHQVPWTRTILMGRELLMSARYNKASAFTHKERRALRLEGLLPPAVETQDEQLRRVEYNLEEAKDDLQKHIFLSELCRKNKKLFYRTLQEHTEKLMPIVYTPTVGLACQRFHSIYRTAAGLYVSLEHAGRVEQLLKNWHEPNIRCIVFTDGERILGLGDLGAQGMGIPIGKLALYTACAGIDPNTTLPVMIDAGTNNQELLDSPLYMGLRRNRARGQFYDALIEEFITAARKVFGKTVLLQFEDFANANALRLLEKYKDRCTTYNDDISGTAAVTVGALFSAVRATGKAVSDNRFLIYGAGSAGIGIADLIAQAVAEDDQVPLADARKCVFLVDSRGLLTKDRPSGGVSPEKAPFAQEHEHMGPGLLEIVRKVRPTAIIGVAAQPRVFTQEVCELMAEITEQPIIFPLSNPTSKAECTLEEAVRWTKGKVVFASGSPFEPVEYEGKTYHGSQSNNAYIFPGVSMGISATRSRRVTDRMFLLAARTLARQVSEKDMAEGRILPRFSSIRDVSRQIAATIAAEVYDCGLATVMPRPADLEKFIRSKEWSTKYREYSHEELGQ